MIKDAAVLFEVGGGVLPLELEVVEGEAKLGPGDGASRAARDPVLQGAVEPVAAQMKERGSAEELQGLRAARLEDEAETVHEALARQRLRLRLQVLDNGLVFRPVQTLEGLPVRHEDTTRGTDL